ncbi:MAG: PEP-CTERM sorting domain-containing protein [Candidatus Omnitrophica bacterium]|nr:PEP-CTERM sorting domain-containing protein [Candidatus Omnitrophota bacterium]
MKTRTFTLLFFSFAICFSLIAPAQAAVFVDVVDLNTTITEVYGTFDANPSWQHNISDVIGGNAIGDINITDAVLTLEFSGTSGNTVGTIGIVGYEERCFPFIGCHNVPIIGVVQTPNPESWSLEGLGSLLSTNDGVPVSQDFSFGPGELADLQADGIFTAIPHEWSWNPVLDLIENDSFYAIRSTLTGNYSTNTVIPEPTTFALLGMGLLGLAGFRRNR